MELAYKDFKIVVLLALLYGGKRGWIMSKEMVKFRKETETLKKNLGVPVPLWWQKPPQASIPPTNYR